MTHPDENDEVTSTRRNFVPKPTNRVIKLRLPKKTENLLKTATPVFGKGGQPKFVTKTPEKFNEDNEEAKVKHKFITKPTRQVIKLTLPKKSSTTSSSTTSILNTTPFISFWNSIATPLERTRASFTSSERVNEDDEAITRPRPKFITKPVIRLTLPKKKHTTITSSTTLSSERTNEDIEVVTKSRPNVITRPVVKLTLPKKHKTTTPITLHSTELKPVSIDWNAPKFIHQKSTPFELTNAPIQLPFEEKSSEALETSDVTTVTLPSSLSTHEIEISSIVIDQKEEEQDYGSDVETMGEADSNNDETTVPGLESTSEDLNVSTLNDIPLSTSEEVAEQTTSSSIVSDEAFETVAVANSPEGSLPTAPIASATVGLPLTSETTISEASTLASDEFGVVATIDLDKLDESSSELATKPPSEIENSSSRKEIQVLVPTTTLNPLEYTNPYHKPFDEEHKASPNPQTSSTGKTSSLSTETESPISVITLDIMSLTPLLTKYIISSSPLPNREPSSVTTLETTEVDTEVDVLEQAINKTFQKDIETMQDNSAETSSTTIFAPTFSIPQFSTESYSVKPFTFAEEFSRPTDSSEVITAEITSPTEELLTPVATVLTQITEESVAAINTEIIGSSSEISQPSSQTLQPNHEEQTTSQEISPQIQPTSASEIPDLSSLNNVALTEVTLPEGVTSEIFEVQSQISETEVENWETSSLSTEATTESKEPLSLPIIIMLENITLPSEATLEPELYSEAVLQELETDSENAETTKVSESQENVVPSSSTVALEATAVSMEVPQMNLETPQSSKEHPETTSPVVSETEVISQKGQSSEISGTPVELPQVTNAATLSAEVPQTALETLSESFGTEATSRQDQSPEIKGTSSETAEAPRVSAEITLETSSPLAAETGAVSQEGSTVTTELQIGLETPVTSQEHFTSSVETSETEAVSQEGEGILTSEELPQVTHTTTPLSEGPQTSIETILESFGTEATPHEHQSPEFEKTSTETSEAPPISAEVSQINLESSSPLGAETEAISQEGTIVTTELPQIGLVTLETSQEHLKSSMATSMAEVGSKEGEGNLSSEELPQSTLEGTENESVSAESETPMYQATSEEFTHRFGVETNPENLLTTSGTKTEPQEDQSSEFRESSEVTNAAATLEGASISLETSQTESILTSSFEVPQIGQETPQPSQDLLTAVPTGSEPPVLDQSLETKETSEELSQVANSATAEGVSEEVSQINLENQPTAEEYSSTVSEIEMVSQEGESPEMEVTAEEIPQDGNSEESAENLHLNLESQATTREYSATTSEAEAATQEGQSSGIELMSEVRNSISPEGLTMRTETSQGIHQTSETSLDNLVKSSEVIPQEGLSKATSEELPQGTNAGIVSSEATHEYFLTSPSTASEPETVSQKGQISETKSNPEEQQPQVITAVTIGGETLLRTSPDQILGSSKIPQASLQNMLTSPPVASEEVQHSESTVTSPEVSQVTVEGGTVSTEVTQIASEMPQLTQQPSLTSSLTSPGVLSGVTPSSGGLGVATLPEGIILEDLEGSSDSTETELETSVNTEPEISKEPLSLPSMIILENVTLPSEATFEAPELIEETFELESVSSPLINQQSGITSTNFEVSFPTIGIITLPTGISSEDLLEHSSEPLLKLSQDKSLTSSMEMPQLFNISTFSLEGFSVKPTLTDNITVNVNNTEANVLDLAFHSLQTDKSINELVEKEQTISTTVTQQSFDIKTSIEAISFSKSSELLSSTTELLNYNATVKITKPEVISESQSISEIPFSNLLQATTNMRKEEEHLGSSVPQLTSEVTELVKSSKETAFELTSNIPEEMLRKNTTTSTRKEGELVASSIAQSTSETYSSKEASVKSSGSTTQEFHKHKEVTDSGVTTRRPTDEILEEELKHFPNHGESTLCEICNTTGNESSAIPHKHIEMTENKISTPTASEEVMEEQLKHFSVHEASTVSQELKTGTTNNLLVSTEHSSTIENLLGKMSSVATEKSTIASDKGTAEGEKYSPTQERSTDHGITGNLLEKLSSNANEASTSTLSLALIPNTIEKSAVASGAGTIEGQQHSVTQEASTNQAITSNLLETLSSTANEASTSTLSLAETPNTIEKSAVASGVGAIEGQQHSVTQETSTSQAITRNLLENLSSTANEASSSKMSSVEAPSSIPVTASSTEISPLASGEPTAKGEEHSLSVESSASHLLTTLSHSISTDVPHKHHQGADNKASTPIPLEEVMDEQFKHFPQHEKSTVCELCNASEPIESSTVPHKHTHMTDDQISTQKPLEEAMEDQFKHFPEHETSSNLYQSSGTFEGMTKTNQSVDENWNYSSVHEGLGATSSTKVEEMHEGVSKTDIHGITHEGDNHENITVQYATTYEESTKIAVEEASSEESSTVPYKHTHMTDDQISTAKPLEEAMEDQFKHFPEHETSSSLYQSSASFEGMTKTNQSIDENGKYSSVHEGLGATSLTKAEEMHEGVSKTDIHGITHEGDNHENITVQYATTYEESTKIAVEEASSEESSTVPYKHTHMTDDQIATAKPLEEAMEDQFKHFPEHETSSNLYQSSATFEGMTKTNQSIDENGKYSSVHEGLDATSLTKAEEMHEGVSKTDIHGITHEGDNHENITVQYATTYEESTKISVEEASSEEWKQSSHLEALAERSTNAITLQQSITQIGVTNVTISSEELKQSSPLENLAERSTNQITVQHSITHGGLTNTKITSEGWKQSSPPEVLVERSTNAITIQDSITSNGVTNAITASEEWKNSSLREGLSERSTNGITLQDSITSNGVAKPIITSEEWKHSSLREGLSERSTIGITLQDSITSNGVAKPIITSEEWKHSSISEALAERSTNAITLQDSITSNGVNNPIITEALAEKSTDQITVPPSVTNNGLIIATMNEEQKHFEEITPRVGETTGQEEIHSSVHEVTKATNPGNNHDETNKSTSTELLVDKETKHEIVWTEFSDVSASNTHYPTSNAINLEASLQTPLTSHVTSQNTLEPDIMSSTINEAHLSKFQSSATANLQDTNSQKPAEVSLTLEASTAFTSIHIDLPVYPKNTTASLDSFEKYYSGAMSSTESVPPAPVPTMIIEDDEATDCVLDKNAFRSMKLEDFNMITEFPPTTVSTEPTGTCSLMGKLSATSNTPQQYQELKKTELTEKIQATTELDQKEAISSINSPQTVNNGEENVSEGLESSSFNSETILTTISGEYINGPIHLPQTEAHVTDYSTIHEESTSGEYIHGSMHLPQTEAHVTDYSKIHKESTSGEYIHGSTHLSQTQPYITEYPKMQEESTCKPTDFESHNNCICSIDNLVKDLRIKFSHSSPEVNIFNYSCPILTHIETGIILGNGSIPQVSRRHMKGPSIRKREIIDNPNIEKTLNEQLQLKGKENEIFATPGMKIRIPCMQGSSSNIPENIVNYTWTFANNLPLTEGKVQEGEGALTIEYISAQDGGNYTCTVVSGSGESKSSTNFEHHLSVVALPTYTISTTILYNSTENCQHGDADIVSLYFPNVLGSLICGNYFPVCNVEVKDAQCVNNSQDYISANLSTSVEPMNVIMPTINTTVCDVNCEMNMYTRIVLFIIKNLETIEKLPVFFRLAYRQQKLIPTERITKKTKNEIGTEAPKLIIACPPGFGYHKKTHICGACERNQFSRGDETFCTLCPAGQYQPMVGSKSCLVCSTPLQDPFCLRVVYSNSHKFRIVIGVTAGILIGMLILLVLCMRSPKSAKTSGKIGREEYLKSKRHAKRRSRDVDLEKQEDTEPLLADRHRSRKNKNNKKPPEPPPPDFM